MKDISFDAFGDKPEDSDNRVSTPIVRPGSAYWVGPGAPIEGGAHRILC